MAKSYAAMMQGSEAERAVAKSQTVYVLSLSKWAQGEIYGIFSTEEKAREALAQMKDTHMVEIDAYGLDAWCE